MMKPFAEMRPQCEACRHMIRCQDPQTTAALTIMRCSVVKVHAGTGKWEYCFNARVGGDCGEEAKLWEPKT